jgi:hypothetical protein
MRSFRITYPDLSFDPSYFNLLLPYPQRRGALRRSFRRMTVFHTMSANPLEMASFSVNRTNRVKQDIRVANAV